MNFEKVLTDDVKKLGRVFKEHGFELRVVGGSVRDVILGKDPKDIDLCSDATPEEMINFLESNGYKTYPTGINHGTISVMSEELYEITTLRIDVETNGRHAEVEFTRDFKEDAARRDFTINAMSVDMTGKLYDYFGGYADLENEHVRFVGYPHQRIEEDYLRILRYFRFYGRMKDPILDYDVKEAISLHHDGLEGISGERIWMEMSKILKANRVDEVLYFMDVWGVSRHINLPFDFFNIDRNIDINKKSKKLSPIAFLGFLTQTFNKMEITANHWKLSRRERDLYAFILNNKDWDFTEHDIKVALSNGVDREFLVELALANDKDHMVKTIESWNDKFPVTGKDLILNGFKSGPELGKALKDLKSLWQDSEFKLTKEELLKTI